MGECPVAMRIIFFRNLFNYVSTANAAQMALDNLQWILAWTWNAFDTLSGGEPGVRDGPGGPLVIGMPGTVGDKHAEGMLFVAPGYESPDGLAIDANACWASLHSKFVEWGAADGAFVLQIQISLLCFRGRAASTTALPNIIARSYIFGRKGVTSTTTLPFFRCTTTL